MDEITAEIDGAWQKFAERIRAAGELITGPDFPGDPRLRAEGYRYVMRLAAQAHYLFVEFGDTVRPTLFPRGGDVFAYGATNVDNNNSRCMVDPGGVYRVTGDVGGVSDLIASVYEGEFVFGKPGVLAEVKLDELHVGDDGVLELFLGGPERPELDATPAGRIVFRRATVHRRLGARPDRYPAHRANRRCRPGRQSDAGVPCRCS